MNDGTSAAIYSEPRQERFPSVIRSLQRQALMGWIVALVLLVLLAVFVFLQSLRQPVILTINEKGQLVGQLEVFNPVARNEIEILAFSKQFLSMHLSLNSSTVYDDAAMALTMMTPELRKKWLNQYRENNFLKTLEQSNSRGSLNFEKVQIQSRKGDKVQVFLSGSVALEGLNAHDFKVDLHLVMTPRTIAYPYGIRVVEIIDL